MRRGVASAVVVAAVAAVGTLAVADVVRPLELGFDPGRDSPLDAEAAAELAELGFTGTLVYTDRDCRLHALSLPELEPAAAPDGEPGCEFSLSPDGREAAPAAARWSLGGERCPGLCAWRGEELTTVRDGEIHSEAGVLVSRTELERAVRTRPFAARREEVERLRVRDLAWLSREEVAALVEFAFFDGPPENMAIVAGFRNGRLAWQRAYIGRFERLVVSPAGEVWPEPPPRPHPFLTDRLRLGGPFAWSPDGRRMAIATRASVFLVDLPSERHVRIPVTARDVAWR